MARRKAKDTAGTVSAEPVAGDDTLAGLGGLGVAADMAPADDAVAPEAAAVLSPATPVPEAFPVASDRQEFVTAAPDRGSPDADATGTEGAVDENAGAADTDTADTDTADADTADTGTTDVDHGVTDESNLRSGSTESTGEGAVAAPIPPVPPAPRVDEPRVGNARRGGVLSLIAGGIIAGGIGFGAAAWLLGAGTTFDDTALTARIAAQDNALAALETRLDGLPAAPDLTPLRAEIADIRADLVAQTEGLRPAIDTLTERVNVLERAPAADGTLPDAALAAWQGELDALRADLVALSTRTDTISEEMDDRIAATVDALAQIEVQAAEAAALASERAALVRIGAALDSGAPFADVLAELGSSAPALAVVAGEGAPTPVTLRDAFPEAARAALSVARAEGLSGEDGNRVTAFLRDQFAVRSTAPREGDDPDAILSRAEAALHDNRLDDALAEIASLPEVVRAAMGGWLTLAETRRAALAELQSLSGALADAETTDDN